MSRVQEAVKRHRHEILSLARLYGLGNVRIFGSVARGSDDESSDLDLLVDLPSDTSLLALGGFLMDVRDLVGIPVDVVSTKMLKARSRDRVLGEAIPL